MATCKDCLHNEMCYATHTDDSPACCDFKDRSKYVVREKGEWILNRNGSATCKKCLHTTLDAWGFGKWLNFCPNCGADMRIEEQNRAREVENDG